jgi:hypothetical protein
MEIPQQQPFVQVLFTGQFKKEKMLAVAHSSF